MNLEHLVTENKGTDYDEDMSQEDGSQFEEIPEAKSKTI